jgi:hypothetical protein
MWHIRPVRIIDLCCMLPLTSESMLHIVHYYYYTSKATRSTSAMASLSLGLGILGAGLAGRVAYQLFRGGKGGAEQFVRGGFKAKMDKAEALAVLGLRYVYFALNQLSHRRWCIETGLSLVLVPKLIIQRSNHHQQAQRRASETHACQPPRSRRIAIHSRKGERGAGLVRVSLPQRSIYGAQLADSYRKDVRR